MSILEVRRDMANSTMTVTTEWDAPIERVWELWSDPRALERWWGPPTYPATVGTHEFMPGGTVSYSMTGPEGDQHKGFWSVISVDPPRSFVAVGRVAHAAGSPPAPLPVPRFTVTLDERGGRTRMVIESRFESAQHLQEVLDMGMEEGLAAALGQIDTVLTER
ncbi:MAG: SRPBCC family protein [Ilumatobacteraceae bacterium]